MKTNICCKLPVPSSSIFHSFIHPEKKVESTFLLCANLMHDYTHMNAFMCSLTLLSASSNTHSQFLQFPSSNNFSSLMRHRWLLDWWCRFDRFSLSSWLLLSYYIAIFQFAFCMLHAMFLLRFTTPAVAIVIWKKIARERKWIRRPCRNGQRACCKRKEFNVFYVRLHDDCDNDDWGCQNRFRCAKRDYRWIC